MIRLQKALADRGVASRRKAEELIVGGRVHVDGELVTALGTKVRPDARIDVDGTPTRQARQRYIVLNKPVGIVSSVQDERGRKTVVALVGAPERIYPVGRLDTDSEGMLLLTNDGEWAEKVLHPRYGHEREYDVSVIGSITPGALMALRDGVRLEEGLAVATHIEVTRKSRSASRMTIVLHTGWRRQVRRMLAAVGLKVTRLVRVRIGTMEIGKLRTGEWRDLTPREIADLARPAAPRPAPARPRPARVELAPAAVPKPSQRRAPSAQRPGRTGPSQRPARPGSAPRSSRWSSSAQRPTSRGAQRPPQSRPTTRSQPPRGPRRAPLVRGVRKGMRRPATRYGETRGPVRAKVAPR
ncbi:MAG TPA: pseudouridine synthase [Verrucomicrobiae bacterium]|nr:pseudouridine synthase [Verrucomicrobiae bacterium]